MILAVLLAHTTVSYAADRENLVLGLIGESPSEQAEQPSQIQDIEQKVEGQTVQIEKNNKILKSILQEQSQLDITKKELYTRLNQLERNKTGWEADKKKMLSLYVSMQKSLKQSQQKTKHLQQKKKRQQAILSKLTVVGQSQNKVWLKDGTGKYYMANLGEHIKGYGQLHKIDENNQVVFAKTR